MGLRSTRLLRPRACFSFAPGLAPSNPEFFEKKRILEKIAAATRRARRAWTL